MELFHSNKRLRKKNKWVEKLISTHLFPLNQGDFTNSTSPETMTSESENLS